MTSRKSASVKKKASPKAVRTRARATAAPAPKASAKKKTAAAPKKKATLAKKTLAKKKTTAAPPKKATLAKKKKTTTAAAKKPVAKKKAAAAAAKPRAARRPRPSEQALEVVVQRPSERPLTDEEREAMQKCAHTAAAALAADGVPEVIVSRIGRFIDDVRAGTVPEPTNQDVRLGLGVLWGEQVRAQVGWRWVHLSYPNGFASYALVPDDRAFACFPLNRIGDLLHPGADGVNTSVPLFDSIRVGTLPLRSENAYLVIG
jgi:hypothetical protein